MINIENQTLESRITLRTKRLHENITRTELNEPVFRGDPPPGRLRSRLWGNAPNTATITPEFYLNYTHSRPETYPQQLMDVLAPRTFHFETREVRTYENLSYLHALILANAQDHPEDYKDKNILTPVWHQHEFKYKTRTYFVNNPHGGQWYHTETIFLNNWYVFLSDLQSGDTREGYGFDNPYILTKDTTRNAYLPSFGGPRRQNPRSTLPIRP